MSSPWFGYVAGYFCPHILVQNYCSEMVSDPRPRRWISRLEGDSRSRCNLESSSCRIIMISLSLSTSIFNFESIIPCWTLRKSSHKMLRLSSASFISDVKYILELRSENEITDQLGLLLGSRSYTAIIKQIFEVHDKKQRSLPSSESAINRPSDNF